MYIFLCSHVPAPDEVHCVGKTVFPSLLQHTPISRIALTFKKQTALLKCCKLKQNFTAMYGYSFIYAFLNQSLFDRKHSSSDIPTAMTRHTSLNYIVPPLPFYDIILSYPTKLLLILTLFMKLQHYQPLTNGCSKASDAVILVSGFKSKSRSRRWYAELGYSASESQLVSFEDCGDS